MSAPRRRPKGFEAYAHLPIRQLMLRYYADFYQVVRWKEECGVTERGIFGRPGRETVQMDLDGNELRRYRSTREAARAVYGRAPNIGKAARKPCGYAYGYRWSY